MRENGDLVLTGELREGVSDPSAGAPIIVEQPVAHVANPESVTSFTVTATGFGALLYQWRKDGAPLIDDERVSGAATSFLEISAIAEADQGGYDCVVANAYGETASSAAALTVNDPPIVVFTVSPTNHPLTLYFDATGSCDADGEIENIAWGFGDGATATGTTATHTYSSFGVHPTQASATDNNGYTTVKSDAIRVNETRLLPNPAGEGDRFGISVAISGSTVFAGAACAYNGGTSWVEGAAYAFVEDEDTKAWAQQGDKLYETSGAQDDDQFGYSVDIDGDTALVGIRSDYVSGAGSAAGSAQVFVRSGSTWSAQGGELTASDKAANDYFGGAVAVDGDLAVIGATGDDDKGSMSGSAYVFTRSGGSWTQTAKLTAPDGASYDRFGCSVAISSQTIVVGAYGADPDGVSNAGAAYVFLKNGVSWTQQAKLTHPDKAASDQFGGAVAIDGDTLVVGTLFDDVATTSDCGSAYVFTRVDDEWSTQPVALVADDPGAEDHFGSAVALDGDFTMVGAPQDDDNGANSGSAYVFVKANGEWSQELKLTPNDATSGDAFGNAVSVDGHRAAVGAFTADDNGTDSGKMYVYNLLGVGVYIDEERFRPAEPPAAKDDFGWISEAAAMPALSARLIPEGGFSGSVDWTMGVKYERPDRQDADTYTSTVQANDAWDIVVEMGEDVRGGTAAVSAFYDGTTVTQYVYIRGHNATTHTTQNYIQSHDVDSNRDEHWYAYAIAKHESKLSSPPVAYRYYNQFNPPGTRPTPSSPQVWLPGPKWEDIIGCPNRLDDEPNDGWGLFQMTNPRATKQQLWDWQDNTDSAIELLRQKRSYAMQDFEAHGSAPDYGLPASIAISGHEFTATATGHTMVDLQTIKRFHGGLFWSWVEGVGWVRVQLHSDNPEYPLDYTEKVMSEY